MIWTPLSRHKFTRNKVESFPVLPIYSRIRHSKIPCNIGTGIAMPYDSDW